MNRSLLLFLAVTLCGALHAETLSLVSGNGQLVPANLGLESAPIVFQLTNGTTPVANQVITFSNAAQLTATSVTTNASGQATVYFLPGYLTTFNSFIQYQYTATATGASSVPFTESSFYVSTSSVYDVTPQLVSGVSLSSTYTAAAGSPGTPIVVQVSAQYGYQAGETLQNVAVRPQLVTPDGNPAGTPPTPLQTVSCKEAHDAQGNVFTNADGTATCTPIFQYPNASYPPGTNSFEFQIVAGGYFVFPNGTGYAYNITASPLVFTGGPQATLANVLPVNTQSSLAVTASGGVPPYTFSLVNGSSLPGGLTLNAQTGSITGETNATPGVYPFEVQVKDQNSPVDSAASSFGIAVSGGALGLTPPVAPPALTGTAYTQTFTVTGGVPPYKITASGNNLPAWITVTPIATAVQVSGTPTASGTVALTVNVTDDIGETFSGSLSIKVSSPLAIAPENTQTAAPNSTVTIPLSVSGGVPPYKYSNPTISYSNAGLQAVLTVSSSGVISGTVSGPGVYTVAEVVTDAADETAPIVFSIDVSGGTISDSTTTLPTATAGVPYTQALATNISGGVPPYTYSAASATGQTVAVSSTGTLTATFTLAGVQTVTLAVTDSTGTSQKITLTIPVLPSIGAITNAASPLILGSVAPGEIVTIYGSGLGPAAGASLVVDADGLITESVQGTQVFFGFNPAPIYYTGAGQINAIVPFEVVPGQSTSITVTSNGQTSAATTLPVVEAAPAIFLLNTPTTNQAAVLDQNLSVNSVNNPVARGNVAVIYATGGGQLLFVPVDGTIPNFPGFLDTISGVTVTIGGQPATILYAGLAPYIAGMIQINAVVPPSVNPGPAVPVVVSIAGADSSAETATIAVQ